MDWVTLLVAIVAALAALLVVPEIRKRLDLDKKEANFSRKHAIRIDYRYFSSFSDGVVLDFDPKIGLGYYIDKNLIAYSNPYMSIDVTSLSTSEWIKLAPYCKKNQVLSTTRGS
jgi:hypothetical protein